VIYRYDAELGEEELGVQIGSEGEDFVMALAGNFDLQGDIVMVGSTQSESLVDEHMFDSQTNGSKYRVGRYTTFDSEPTCARFESWTHELPVAPMKAKMRCYEDEMTSAVRWQVQ